MLIEDVDLKFTNGYMKRFTATASSIADELSEHEHKKNNIIVYNLPEAT